MNGITDFQCVVAYFLRCNLREQKYHRLGWPATYSAVSARSLTRRRNREDGDPGSGGTSGDREINSDGIVFRHVDIIGFDDNGFYSIEPAVDVDLNQGADLIFCSLTNGW